MISTFFFCAGSLGFVACFQDPSINIILLFFLLSYTRRVHDIFWQRRKNQERRYHILLAFRFELLSPEIAVYHSNENPRHILQSTTLTFPARPSPPHALVCVGIQSCSATRVMETKNLTITHIPVCGSPVWFIPQRTAELSGVSSDVRRNTRKHLSGGKLPPWQSTQAKTKIFAITPVIQYVRYLSIQRQ